MTPAPQSDGAARYGDAGQRRVAADGITVSWESPEQTPPITENQSGFKRRSSSTTTVFSNVDGRHLASVRRKHVTWDDAPAQRQNKAFGAT